MNNIPSTIDHRPSTNKGFILLLTLVFMTILTVFTGALIYMTMADMRNSVPQSDDVNLGGLADAGIDKAHRAIRDDYAGSAPSPGSATGVADLRGASVSENGSVSNEDNIRYLEDGNAAFNDAADEVFLKTFDSNYTNTRIISVQLGVRASRSSGSGTPPTIIEVAYAANGSFPEAGNTVLTQTLSTGLTYYYADITADRAWTWATIMSPNFTLRARRTSGSRNVNVDILFLRVAYGIDTLQELWATGGYAGFPITLGNGTIQSITITDEAGKVHLNYAAQALLSNLLTNLEISAASTKATAAVNYRGASLTNPFDSVEELKQVSGITSTDYDTIKDYVTVYSFINSNVYRPNNPPPRAPVNINTASDIVLKSIFDSSGLGVDDAESLADDIITQRNISPFQGFYSASSAAGDNTYFYNFIVNQGYLSTSGNPDENDRALDTADASSLIPVSGSNSYLCPTTELCYTGNVFYINVLARVGARNFRVKTIRGNDGSHIFAAYSGDTTLSGWRKENFE